MFIFTAIGLVLGVANLANQVCPEHRPFYVYQRPDGTYGHKFVPDPPYLSQRYKTFKDKERLGFVNPGHPDQPLPPKPAPKPLPFDILGRLAQAHKPKPVAPTAVVPAPAKPVFTHLNPKGCTNMLSLLVALAAVAGLAYVYVKYVKKDPPAPPSPPAS